MTLPFKRKSKLEQLKENYRSCMRKSFKLALKDRDKSLLVHHKACEIQKEIDMLKIPS